MADADGTAHHCRTPGVYPLKEAGQWRRPQLMLWIFLLLALAGCNGAVVETPREATRRALASLPPTPTATPMRLPAPTPTGSPPAPTPGERPTVELATLTVWVDETSAEHERVLQAMVDEFATAQGMNVELLLVKSDLLPSLVATAVLSDTLPDILFHPLEYTVGWAERGILNPALAATAVERLGRASFDPASLALVAVEDGITALPSDGFKQLIVYRSDWFEERELPPPDDYERMLMAAQTMHFTPTLTAGFVVPTESDLTTTQFAFEHIATANGCRLIDARGEVQILEPACAEAMAFYRTIVNGYSPSDVQTDISTLNAYLAGRGGLIMAPPSILPALAGLDPGFPPSCPRCEEERYLAENSAFITTLGGGTSPAATEASFGTIHYLGLTTAADEAAALAFAEYWFNEGYLSWLSVDMARKVPLRWGDGDEPRRFIDAWPGLPLAPGGPSLAEVYGQETARLLSEGVATSERWGFGAGQGALVALLYEELTFSILLQEMLSGYFDDTQTIAEAYVRVTELIPNYPFYPTPEPTTEP